MKTILILGGYGCTGKCLARHLLKETGANIVIAGRNLEKATCFAEELNSPRATAIQADAADFNSLTHALHGIDLCLVAAPTTHHAETVIRACIDSRVDYLDVQFSSKKLGALYAAEDEIKKAGLCFITEAGYHPGLPAGLVRYAAAKLDVLESALTAGYIGMANIPYTEAADELMEAFRDYQAQVYKNGAWTKPSAWDMRKFDFGGDIGERACYSMFFEELRALPGMYPSLKNLGFYIAGWNWLADMIVTPLVFIGLKVAPKRGVRPLGKLMWWAMGKSPPPHLMALKVEAKGQRNGKPAQVSVRISHPDGYEITAIPVAAYLLQYLDGAARLCGVHLMGQVAEPVRLFKDMQRMGAEVIEFPDRSSM
jgi:saccharopine dehydrogenase (NAD+, L-lysine-forming)